MKIIETKSISKLIGKYVCITIDEYNIDQIEYKLKINEFLDKRCVAKEGVGTIHAMVKQGDYVETYPFDAIYKPIDMQLMYGEKFITFHNHLLNKLTNDTSGIALLHGLPGTGKSNYIKYLSSIT